MKVFLMHRDRDFCPADADISNTLDLAKDLELETVLRAMANGDAFLLDVARSALLLTLDNADAILYRQRVLRDCLEHTAVVQKIYAIAVEAVEREKKVWGWISERYLRGTLNHGIRVLRLFSELFRKLRDIAARNAHKFNSDGFQRLFRMIGEELDDDYLSLIDGHLEYLRFRGGVVMTAELGPGNKGANYVLRKPLELRRNWFQESIAWLRQFVSRDRSKLFYQVPERDDAGLRALSDLSDEGIAHAAAALAQSRDHILGFFNMLRLELGFYLGCTNLHARLTAKGEPVAFPEPVDSGKVTFSAAGLYDPSLSLNTNVRAIGNDICADGKLLTIVTGANRGGKSTALRSIGLAQSMMQSGMFVAAKSFSADLRSSIFTHFKRQEDSSMRSGKLDEELSRMSSIVDRSTANSLILFNESFASTNEREGAEIAHQIVRALIESGVKVVFVTHMYDLAHRLYKGDRDGILFLRAERSADGRRTFRLSEGEPLSTSHAEDLYRQLF